MTLFEQTIAVAAALYIADFFEAQACDRAFDGGEFSASRQRTPALIDTAYDVLDQLDLTFSERQGELLRSYEAYELQDAFWIKSRQDDLLFVDAVNEGEVPHGARW